MANQARSPVGAGENTTGLRRPSNSARSASAVNASPLTSRPGGDQPDQSLRDRRASSGPSPDETAPKHEGDHAQMLQRDQPERSTDSAGAIRTAAGSGAPGLRTIIGGTGRPAADDSISVANRRSRVSALFAEMTQ